MDEIQGNNIARNFSSEYFNYTINFIISKEFPALTDFPDFSLILCDLDKNIELAKKHNLPVIAFSHKNNRQESLMGTPWLILDTDGLSPFFLNEVYCRHYKKPLTITTTNRCIIRELTTRQLPELLQLQEENKNNPLSTKLYHIRRSRRISSKLYKKSICILWIWNLWNLQQRK